MKQWHLQLFDLLTLIVVGVGGYDFGMAYNLGSPWIAVFFFWFVGFAAFTMMRRQIVSKYGPVVDAHGAIVQ